MKRGILLRDHHNLKVLILTASFGNGHKSVANALEKEFIKNNTEVNVLDLFAEAFPKVNNITKHAYLKSYDLGELYGLFYKGIGKIAHNNLGNWYRRLGKHYLSKIINEINPDLIVNTFPIMSVIELKRKNKINIPIFTIITDFCANNIWLDHNIDRFYLATEDLKYEVSNWSIPMNKIVVSGIPIREGFEKEESPEKYYIKYNLNPNKEIILISAGAFGVLKDIERLCINLTSRDDIQVAVVCGNNKNLKTQLEELNIDNLKIYGYISDIHKLYKISTCLISKPGGITLSEALATHLPVILHNPVPGQEGLNAQYFQKKGAAIITYKEEDIINNAFALIEDNQKIENIKSAMDSFYYPNSSKIIVKDILMYMKSRNQESRVAKAVF